MVKYELSVKDYQEIYERAVREFNTTSTNSRKDYDYYLIQCFISSFKIFSKANNLVMHEGEFYAAKED